MAITADERPRTPTRADAVSLVPMRYRRPARRQYPGGQFDVSDFWDVVLRVTTPQNIENTRQTRSWRPQRQTVCRVSRHSIKRPSPLYSRRLGICG